MQNTISQTDAELVIQQQMNDKERRRNRMIAILPFSGLVLLILVFTVLTGGRFLNAENLKIMLNQSYTMMIVIIGATFLYASSGLNLAIGSVLAMAALIIALLTNAGMALLPSLLVGMVVAVALMSLNYFVSEFLHVSAFIVSMCIMNVCGGIILTITGKSPVYFAYSRFSYLDTAWVRIAVLAVLILVAWLLFEYSPLGKSLKFMGGSRKVAKISGMNTRLTEWLAYALTGAFLGIAALFVLLRTNAVSASTGSSTSMNALTAVVLGGFPLNGGPKSKFFGPIVGAVTVAVLSTGLSLLGYADSTGYLIKGILFIIVVALTYDRSHGKLIA